MRVDDPSEQRGVALRTRVVKTSGEYRHGTPGRRLRRVVRARSDRSPVGGGVGSHRSTGYDDMAIGSQSLRDGRRGGSSVVVAPTGADQRDGVRACRQTRRVTLTPEAQRRGPVPAP